MFSTRHNSLGWRQHAGWSALPLLTISVVLAVSLITAPAAVAIGAHFQRGDVVASDPGGIARYAPDGTPEGTLSSASGASLCFDPNGDHLIAPGVGLFDSSGNQLASSWASIASPIGECVGDGLGHVYVGGGPSGTTGGGAFWGTIRKFDLTGNLLRSYTVASSSSSYRLDIRNLDLAPDQCTIYYNADGDFSPISIKRFNVCTNTQQPPFGGNGSIADQLRIRPNWQVVSAYDFGWSLLDASGQVVGGVGGSSVFLTDGVRGVALDPDGTSVWIGGGGQPDYSSGKPFENVARFDIASGQLLARWATAVQGNLTPVAAYGPPLLGDANVESTVDSNPAGTAEAFPTQAGYSGQMARLHLYVASSSTASKIVVGIYANRNGHPGTLQKQATISNVRAGSWNYVQVPVPSMPVTAEQRYWIAVLGPRGGGTIRFRDKAGGQFSETSAQHKLLTLPANWSTGQSWASAPVSAYGS